MLDARWLGSADAAATASLDPAVHAAVAEHPHFRALMRPWVETWKVGEHDGAVLARTLRDTGRFFIGLWALYLHATPGGLTRGRLAEALTDSGMSGPGRVASVLLFMRFIRYVEPAPEGVDRRIQRYLPTARMLQAFRARFRRDLETFWPADPVLLRVVPALDRDDVLNAYLAAMGEVTRVAMGRYQAGETSMEVISHRYGGMALLAEILLSAPEEAVFPPTGLLNANLADLARRCDISRAQVRGVLAAAEKAGFLELLPGNRCRLRPLLGEHLNMLLAGSLVVSAYAAHRAAECLDQPEAARSA
ncbi:MAG: hypothetical protein JWR84_4022 [Caulobacter sp.]|nr:hypothetical protein [Caulobacter sp.]